MDTLEHILSKAGMPANATVETHTGYQYGMYGEPMQTVEFEPYEYRSKRAEEALDRAWEASWRAAPHSWA